MVVGKIVRADPKKIKVIDTISPCIENIKTMKKNYLKRFIPSVTGILTYIYLIGVVSPAIAQEKIFLDYRTEDDYSMRSLRQSPALSAKIRQQVLSQVIKKSDKACFGELEPKIRDSAIGSFTETNTQQIAYIVDLGDSCHARYSGTLRLAIFSSDRLVTTADVTGFSRIKLVSDLNEDGLNEITLEGGGMYQGILGVTARAFKISNSDIVLIGQFPSVYVNNFAPGRAPFHQSASVISVKLDRFDKMIFIQRNYLATCTGPEGRIECQDYEFHQIRSSSNE